MFEQNYWTDGIELRFILISPNNLYHKKWNTYRSKPFNWLKSFCSERFSTNHQNEIYRSDWNVACYHCCIIGCCCHQPPALLLWSRMSTAKTRSTLWYGLLRFLKLKIVLVSNWAIFSNPFGRNEKQISLFIEKFFNENYLSINKRINKTHILK